MAAGSITAIVLSATAAVALTGVERAHHPGVDAVRRTTTVSPSAALAPSTTAPATTQPTTAGLATRRPTIRGGSSSPHPTKPANPSPRGGRPGGQGQSPSPRTTTPPPTVAVTTPTTIPATLLSVACKRTPPPGTAVSTTPRLVGTWVLCSPVSLFGAAGADVGIQINADHSWERLGLTPGSDLVALNGVGDAGTWSEAPVAASSSSVAVVFATSSTTAVAGTGETWATTVSLVPGNPAWLDVHETGLSVMYVQSPVPVHAGRILRHPPRHR